MEGAEGSKGLESTVGWLTEAAVTAGFLLRFATKDFLCLRYSCMDSTDQFWHSLQRVSNEPTTSLQWEQMVWESCLRLLILQWHLGQERRAAESTAVEAEVDDEDDEGGVEAIIQEISPGQWSRAHTEGGLTKSYETRRVREITLLPGVRQAAGGVFYPRWVRI